MYHFHCGLLGLGSCCRCRGGLSWLFGLLHLQLGPHYVWQGSETAGRGWDEREGGRRLLYRDRPSPPPPDIMDESIDAVLCTFYADPARRGGKYSASCLWHGSWSLSLAHSVTIIPPCPRATCYCTHIHRGKFVNTYTHTHAPSSKMHLSSVELWHWTVC